MNWARSKPILRDDTHDGMRARLERTTNRMKPLTVLKIGAVLCAAFLSVEAARTHWAAPRPQALELARQATVQTPLQTTTSAPAFQFEGFQVRPLAEFTIQARILAREDYRMGLEAQISPMDLALGWKRMADPAVYKALNVTQGGRWYRYSWQDTPPIAPQEIIETSANMHLIPANPGVARILQRARPDGFIRLSGKLVEVTQDNRWRWTSSLTRSDTGGGACELIFVETAEVN